MNKDTPGAGGLPAGEAETFQASEADIAAARETEAWRTETDRAWRARIEQLRARAEQDGESVNPASEQDFWRFVRSGPVIRKDSLVLADKGRLRADWKDERGSCLGLQFEGGGRVQYKLCKQHETIGDLSEELGWDSFEGVRQHIEAFELQALIYACKGDAPPATGQLTELDT